MVGGLGLMLDAIGKR